MTHYEGIKEQNPSLIYGEGLRVPNTGGTLELEGLYGLSSLGKKKGFDRVNIIINIRE